MEAGTGKNLEGGSSLLNKLITSTALAYIVVDLTGWYETTPEKLICCIGLGLAIAAVWIQIEERRTEHDNNSGRV